MSRRQSVPFNVFYRKADPLPPLFPEPHEGDLYLNTTRGVLRQFHNGSWGDIEGMRWVPFTASGQQFHTDDVVRDGAWTMVANKDTKDRPAPQPTGPVADLLPAWTPTTAFDKTNYTVENTWTMSTAGWIERVGFDVHASNLAKTHRLTCLINDAVVQEIDFYPNIVPSSNGVFWYSVYAQQPITIGTKITLRLGVIEPTAANPDRYWFYQTGLFATAPTYCTAATGSKDGGAATTTAYGVHIEFQPGSKSSDWDLLATSGLGGGVNDIEALDARYVNVGGDTMTNGLGFGSSVAASPTDVSRHLNLYGGTYGFGVTSATLNYNANVGASHSFKIAGTEVVKIAPTGITASQDLTVNKPEPYIIFRGTGYQLFWWPEGDAYFYWHPSLGQRVLAFGSDSGDGLVTLDGIRPGTQPYHAVTKSQITKHAMTLYYPRHVLNIGTAWTSVALGVGQLWNQTAGNTKLSVTSGYITADATVSKVMVSANIGGIAGSPAGDKVFNIRVNGAPLGNTPPMAYVSSSFTWQPVVIGPAIYDRTGNGWFNVGLTAGLTGNIEILESFMTVEVIE